MIHCRINTTIDMILQTNMGGMDLENFEYWILADKNISMNISNISTCTLSFIAKLSTLF